MQLHLNEAGNYIEGFSLNESYYTRLKVNSPWLTVKNQANNLIFSKTIKTNTRKTTISIKFMDNAKWCKVYLGEKIRGNIEIIVYGSYSLFYIGNFCKLKKLEIRSRQDSDCILIGNYVTTHRHKSEQVTFRSGAGSGTAKPSIIIGDDCMFSHGVILRDSDSHPIFDSRTMLQVNEPKKGIIIEPHTWIGDSARIFKNVTIGACSIIGASSIVRKNVERFSVVTGNPATHRKNPSTIWCRNYTSEAKEKAQFFRDKYLSYKNDDVSCPSKSH